MKEGYIQEPPSRFVQDQTSAEQNTSQIPLTAVTLVSAPAFGSAQAPQASQAPQPPQQIKLRFHSVRCFDELSYRET
jgi:hypothetical protein